MTSNKKTTNRSKFKGTLPSQPLYAASVSPALRAWAEARSKSKMDDQPSAFAEKSPKENAGRDDRDRRGVQRFDGRD
jgi:hypothetical protein